jgi:hypothetical protein
VGVESGVTDAVGEGGAGVRVAVGASTGVGVRNNGKLWHAATGKPSPSSTSKPKTSIRVRVMILRF